MAHFGEEYMEGGDRVYLDLRSGWLGETKTISVDDEGQPKRTEYEPYVAQGYQLGYNENLNKDRTYYVSKKRRSIEGFVTSLRWYSNKLRDRDTTLIGWKVTVETPDKVFVIQVDSNDRVFSQLMNSLIGVDFNKTVKFVAYKREGKKNLLMYQDDQEGKDFVRGSYRMRFLTNLLKKKIQEGTPLTDQEKENVLYDALGNFNPNYPYITQNLKEKWVFDSWTDFLITKMNEEVIPNIEEANQARGSNWKQLYSSSSEDMTDETDVDDFAPPQSMSAQAPPGQASATEQLSQREHPGVLPAEPHVPVDLTKALTPTESDPRIEAAKARAAAIVDDDIPF